MSLIPIATEWMEVYPYQSLPAVFYGVLLLMSSITYHLIQVEIIKINGEESQISQNIGKDIKGKISILVYALSIVVAYYLPALSYVIYIAVALIWIVSDNRLEKM